MRVNQTARALRWFFAELLVIVLGISIAFQVEEWRQYREDRVLEVEAPQEVLGDLNAMERQLSQAIDEYEAAAKSATRLVQLIQARSADEDEYLDNLAFGVYLIGETENQYAYEGLLDAGRFAGIDDSELADQMRRLFTSRAPWVYALNVRHIEVWDNLLAELSPDLRQVPDSDFATTGESLSVIAVPLDKFPTSPAAMNGLFSFISSARSMMEKFQLILDDIQDIRRLIDDCLKEH